VILRHRFTCILEPKGEMLRTVSAGHSTDESTVGISANLYCRLYFQRAAEFDPMACRYDHYCSTAIELVKPTGQ
jgi:hypothetical protein